MIQDHLPYYIGYLYYIGIGMLILSILLDNRNPSKTIGYIMVLIFIPIIGLIFYLYFGRDYRKRKLFIRKGFVDVNTLKHWKKEKEEIFQARIDSHPNQSEEIQLVSSLLQNSNAYLSVNNSAKILVNGKEKFNDLIESLKNATHHIHLEYYIIEDDALTQQLFEILKSKVKAGVEVRVIYDDVGSRSISSRLIKELNKCGIEIFPFMPVRYPFFTSSANYRTHRKIAVIDGRTGYLGGINLSQRYLNTATKLFWRDTHLRLDGESVQQLQIQFILMWNFVSDQSLQAKINYFPELPTYKNIPVQIAFSGPDSERANIMFAIFKAIAVAKTEVLITTPYLIPTDQITTAIQTSALSSVEVKIIIPENSDSRIVQSAMMSYIKELLTAGVKVYTYNKGFIHAKTIVIDEMLCTIGTTNMDYRSFNINYEINAFIYNQEMALQLKEQFLIDLKDTREITLERWEKRPLTKKIIESFARLFAPIL